MIKRKYPDGHITEFPEFYERLRRHYSEEERQTMYWIAKNARPDWISLDIGAHIGEYTLLLNHYCPDGKIYAFEAYPPTYEMLKNNLLHNDVSRNIETFNIAVGDKSGRRKVGLWLAGTERFGEQIEDYDFTTVDLFATEHKVHHIDFIKIDVDGWDLEVLAGAQNIIKKQHPVIVIEINKGIERHKHSEREFLDFVGGNHYVLQALDYPSPGNWLCLPMMKGPSICV